MSEVAAPAAPASAPSSPSSPSTPSAPAAPAASVSSPAGGKPLPGPDSRLTEAAPADPAAPKPETAAERKARILKGKVDGKEVEWNLDSIPDDELSNKLQLSEAARIRMQEASNLRKQFADFVKNVKEDPFRALADPAFGLDIEALAEKRLAEKYREQTLPEPERKALEAQRKAEQYERQLQEYQRREAMRRQQEEDARAEREIKAQFEAAIKTSGLPFDDTTLVLMAEEAQVALDDGLDLTPAQLAQRVNKKLRGIHSQVTKGLKGESLLGFLGDDVVKEVLKASLAKVKGKPEVAPTAKPAAAPKAEDKYAQRPNESYEEYRARLVRGV